MTHFTFPNLITAVPVYLCIESRPWSTKSLVRMEMPFPQVTPHGDQTDHAVAAHSGTSSSSDAEKHQMKLRFPKHMFVKILTSSFVRMGAATRPTLYLSRFFSLLIFTTNI